MPEHTVAIFVGQKLSGGGVAEFRLEIPSRTGSEGFDFLDALEKRTEGRIPDPARDRRWLEMMARKESEAKKRA